MLQKEGQRSGVMWREPNPSTSPKREDNNCNIYSPHSNMHNHNLNNVHYINNTPDVGDRGLQGDQPPRPASPTPIRRLCVVAFPSLKRYRSRGSAGEVQYQRKNHGGGTAKRDSLEQTSPPRSTGS